MNWQPAEMTEVRVKRFSASDGKKHGAQRVKADDPVMEEKRYAMGGIKRPQHFGIPGDPQDTRYSNRYKPDSGNWTEQSGDLRCAARLKRKQHDQNDYGQRHHKVMECGCGDVESFDGGEHGQCGCNDGVAVKQSRTDNAEQRNNTGGFARARNGA